MTRLYLSDGRQLEVEADMSTVMLIMRDNYDLHQPIYTFYTSGNTSKRHINLNHVVEIQRV